MRNLDAGRAVQDGPRRTTPADLLRAYNAMDSSRKTRTLKIVEEPCPEQIEMEPR